MDFLVVIKYLNIPVKWYSSWIYVRLEFAVAASLESEILIIDENLAVGVAGFFNKILDKIGDVGSKEGGAIFL